MSMFGWSVGDIISGLKVVWDVYHAVADGPLNAKFEATQFFDEFIHVVSRLSEWEARKAALPHDDRLAQSHAQLRDMCTVFIRRHMLLIQNANPETKAIRPKRSNWLKKAPFTKDQVLTLYKSVMWPAEREEVQRLREKLMLFLHLATFDMQMATHGMVSEIRASNADLLSSNLKLVSSHLDLVSLVSLNLKRVTYPLLEPGRQAKEIDYPMLRQFEQALRPPRPLAAIEAAPRLVELPWQANGQGQQDRDSEYASVTGAAPTNQDGGRFDQNEVRGLISQRLDNLSMRVKRVDTLETISESGSSKEPSPAVISLLQRLRDMRDQISDAVGVMGLNGASEDGLPLIKTDPEAALREELEAWNKLEERIEREILHPPRRSDFSPSGSSTSTTPTKPIPIPSPPRRTTTSSSLSPSNSYDLSGSWDPTRRLSPPSPNLRPRRTSRSLSTSSHSHPESILLEHEFSVHLYYLDHHLNAVIQTISRFDDGEVKSISSISQNGLIRFRHSIDPSTPSNIETSMKPFLDNGHVDKSHKMRVQFKGSHNLKITTQLENQGEKVLRLQFPPVYQFHNQKDYTDFQSLLLNKEVKANFDIQHIKSTDKDAQCRLGTIRILLDPFTSTRCILYFRHISDQKPGFVEWPVDLFKEPKEPSKKCKSLTLESADGRALVLKEGKSLSRRSTAGSVATIATFESSAAPAFARIQERATTKGVKGLVVEFHDAGDCHKFWEEFTTKDTLFSNDSGLGLDLSPTHSNNSPS